MIATVRDKESCSYINKHYDVEWFDGVGKVQSFSGKLDNIDNKYFYFSDISGGLIMIRQEDIRSMICMEDIIKVFNDIPEKSFIITNEMEEMFSSVSEEELKNIDEEFAKAKRVWRKC